MKLSTWTNGALSALIATGTMTACWAAEGVPDRSISDAGPDSGGSGGSGATSTGGSGATGATSAGGSSAGGAPPVMCTQAVDVTCDGPEDCPSGQRCCALWAQEYQQFGCFDSCAAQAADAAAGQALWLEMCHAGDTCEDPAAQCLTSVYLPDNLSRCYDTGNPPAADITAGTGEVNCGSDVCGAGEKCCLRAPVSLSPYCVPEGDTCGCDLPEAGAGGSDGGAGAGGTGGSGGNGGTTSGGSGGTPDAASPMDGSAASGTDASGGSAGCPDGATCCTVAADCAAGESCNTATSQCETTCGDVDHTDCNGGCCNGSACVAGTAKNECGTTGGACTSCTGPASCVSGTCQ